MWLSVFQPLCCSGTFCKCLRYSWNLMQCSKCLYCYNRTELWLRIFRPRQFRSVSAEPLAATHGTLRFREPRLKNTDVASWPEPINHNIRVELVKAGPERHRKKDGLFQSIIRVINVGDSERKAVSCLSAKWFYKTLKKGSDQWFSKFF